MNGGEPTLNERGNMEAKVGEEITLPDGGTVVIDEITIDPECYSDPAIVDPPPAESPEHGHYVRLDIRVATAPAGAAQEAEVIEQPSVSSFNFQFIDSDGVTFNNDMGTFAAYTCLPEDEQFPSGALGPGQKFAGHLVLDVPDPNGTLIYFPEQNIMGGEVGGYEFKLAG